MKGYAVLSEKGNLKLLCFRGGFFIEKIVGFRDNISGKSLTNHIEKDLDLSSIDLDITEDQKYKFYELELKTLPLYLNKIFNILRHFIGGVLITYEVD